MTKRKYASVSAPFFDFPIKHSSLVVLTYLLCNSMAYGVNKGQAVPECPALLSGESATLNLSGYQGQVVLIDFWATWCGPCKKSMPFFNSLQGKYRQDGLEVVAINVDEDTAEAERFLQGFPVNYTSAFDAQGACPQIFGVQAMPSSFLIDRKGIVRSIHLGFRDADKDAIRHEVEALLKE